MKNGLFIVILSFATTSFAQYTPSKADLRTFRQKPLWIDMMADSSVNYYTAVTAFEEFWKDKPEPEGELEGYEEEGHERSFVARLFKSDEKLKEELMQYATEFKRFRFWKRKYAAYVHDDGSIPSDEEIKQLIEQELINRNSK